MMQQTILYNGSRITYNIGGSGDAIMLVHGFGEGSWVWQDQLEALKQYKVVVPQLPGTDGADMIEDMSMEGLADALYAIVQEEKISSLVLIGHSMGGYISLAFAAAYQQKLTGLGLIHSTAYSDSDEKKETRKKGISFMKDNGGVAFLKTATPNLHAPVTKENKPWLIEQHIALSNRFTDAALIRYYESMIKRPDRTMVLKESRVPVLFLAGRCDTAIPLHDVLAQSHLPEVSYIHILEESGHMGMREEKEKTSSAIKTFTEHCYKHPI